MRKVRPSARFGFLFLAHVFLKMQEDKSIFRHRIEYGAHRVAEFVWAVKFDFYAIRLGDIPVRKVRRDVFTIDIRSVEG